MKFTNTKKKNNNEGLLYKTGVSRPLEDMGTGASHSTYTESVQDRIGAHNQEMEDIRLRQQRRQRNRQEFQMAIELAKQNASSNSNVNAGDNRTTAYNKPQSISVYGGYGTLPNPATQGINTAANGANIDYSAVSKKAQEADTENKGWKGLKTTFNNWADKGEEVVSEKQSLNNAQTIIEPYMNNEKLTKLLDQYAFLEKNHDIANASSANRWFDVYGATFKKDYDDIKKQFQAETNVSDEEYEKIAEAYKYYSNNKDNEYLNTVADNIPLAGKLAMSPITVMEDITGNAQGLFAVKDSDTENLDLGRDYNSGSFAAKNFAKAINESIHKDISGYYDENGERVKGAVDEEEHPILNKAATYAYDVPYMGAESIISAMYPGNAGTLFYASGAYTDTLRKDEERGLNERQAQVHAATMGTAEYMLERTPLAHLGELFKHGAGKQTIKSFLLRQMREEGQEEIGSDVVDVIADALISGDKSEMNQNIATYESQEWADKYNNGVRLSHEEATQKAWVEWGLNAVNDYVMAALSAGFTVGVGGALNASADTKTGREIATNNSVTSDIVLNPESENYISDKREDYNSEEEYNAAQKTRQSILDASNQDALGKRISGKEARAITKGVRQAYDALDARSKVVFEARQNAARQEAQMQAIDKVQNAKNASEVESIKEKYANNDAVVAAVEEKKAQMIQSGEATQSDFDNAITPTKAHDIAKSGKEISNEELEKLPEEVQNAYHVGYSEKAHEVTSNIQNTDVTNILYKEKGKSKVEQIKSVSADKNEIVFETESGAKVPASEVEFNERAKYLYNGENGILSLNEPALVQLAIDTEAESQHGISVANVTTPIKTMYTSGQTGISFEEALKGLGVYSKAVSEEVLKKAYEEGTKTNTVTARATTNVKKGRGLIVESTGNEDAYNSQFIDSKGNISEEVRDKFENEVTDTEKKFLELFSKKIGVDIKFTSDNSGNRGEYKPSEGAIYLNLNNGKNMFEVALHEGIGEFLAASNEKAYNQIADSVLNAYAAMNSNKLASDIRAYQQAYKDDKYGDSARGASRELFNDAIGEILSSESNLKKMFDWMISNEGEAQAQKVKKTLVDYFHDIVDMIKSIKKLGGLSRLERNNMRLSEEQANKYADMIFKAMDEAIANRDAENSENQQSDLDERNSKKIVSFKYLSNENKAKIDNAIKSDIAFVRSVQQSDESFSSITSTFNHYVVYDYNQDGEYTITKVYANNNSLKLNDILFELVEKRALLYGRDNRESERFDRYLDRLRAKYGNHSISSIQAEIRSKNGLHDNILNSLKELLYGRYTGSSNENRKSINIDTEGRSLSEGQKNYFSDSKVVDKDGRLKVVFHGTQEEFYEFKPREKGGKNARVEGYGIYFAENQAITNLYGDRQLEGYLNITKPAYSDRKTIKTNDLAKLIKATCEAEARLLMEDGGYDSLDEAIKDTWVSNIVDTYSSSMQQAYKEAAEIELRYADNDKDIIHVIMNDVGVHNYNDAYDFYEILTATLGFDGFITDWEANDGEINTVYIAFNSNQFKNIDNLNPTDNPDIRFSKKVDTEGRTISPAMQQFLSDNASVFYEDGAVKNYYHGTRYAGFTQFDLNRMDDKQSIFLTDSKKVAKTYSGTFEMFEPDREWSFDELDSALSYMTGGDWELEEIDNGYQITKYGDEAGQETVETYESLKQVQEDFIDNYLNKVDLQSGESGGIYNVYVHSTNPLVIDAKGNNWDEIEPKEYYRHYIDVNITKNGDIYSVDAADTRGVYNHIDYKSKDLLEKNFVKLSEDVPNQGLYYEHLYVDEDRNLIPTTTRQFAKYAKENGYDSVVFNNMIDTAIFGNTAESRTPSQVVIVFDSNQVKSVYNENPTSDADIRKSIKVDWDSHNNYEVPARTYDELVGFNGTDEEIEAAEQQDLAVKAYYANIIHSKNFAGLMFEFKDGNRTKQNFLTRSTRKGYDWQYSYGFNNEPHGHNNYKDVNDVVEVYGNVWGDDMTALYQELLDATPREGVKVQVVREGIAEEGRHSVEVFGESSPYADTLKQTEYVSQVLSTLNNQMKGSSVSLKYIDDTVKYIMDKYQANLNPEELTQELVQFIGYMTANEKVDYNQMMNYLMNVGDKVIQTSELKDPESERIYGELKKELSSHKIALSEKERKELISKFGGEWKTVFGKLNSIGIKLDSKNGQRMDAGIYEDIAKQFREIAGVYLDESTTPVDQIATIIDAMDAVQPTAYEWEGANQMDKALDVATTIIDRYYSMASSIKESNIVRGTEKGNAAVERAKQAEIKRLRAKQAEWKEKLNEDFAALVEDKKKMVAEQQEFYRKQAEIERKFKGEQRKFNQKMNMSEKELEKTAKVLAKIEYQGIKDTEAKRKNKDNIVRTCTRLINWMEKPTDARHVPTFLKPALSDMIKAIDFMPASMRKGNDGTISAQKWQTSMRKLQQVLSTINSQTMESMDDSDKYNLALVLDAEDIVVKMEELLNKYSGTADISRMSKEDLKTLSDIMTNISKGISQMNENFMNRRYKHVSDAAVAAMEEMDKQKSISDASNRIKNATGNMLNLEMLEPISFFEELGDASASIMQEFFDGEKIGIEIIREADKTFNDLRDTLNVKNSDIRQWREEFKDYTFDGRKISLTQADIMSLYCSYKRENLDQAERPFEATHHIMAGGIKGQERKIGVGPMAPIRNRASRPMHLTQGQILELLNTLSETQMAYADKVVEYMSTTLAEHGNETSNKIAGYSKFLGKYYFPLKTDSNTIATTESNNETGMAGMLSLIHQSFTKSQLAKADNALVLNDFFDVVAEHVTGMSNYCAYAMPVSDAMRWYNYSETERNNTDVEDEWQRDTRTLKESMVRVKGQTAKKYFEKFIRDVNMNTDANQGSELGVMISKGLTGLAKAKAIGLNVSVWVQQPTAIVRASDIIESKYLRQGIAKMMKNPKQSMKYAQDTNYLCYWKSKGLSDYRVKQGMTEIITGVNTKMQKAQEVAGAPAGIADDATWAAMYFAAENKIKATTNLNENSEEFRTAVDELFSDIINHTQVIDSQLRKTKTMRSNNEWEIAANAFKKEPQKSYNMLHRKAWQVYQAQTEEEIKEARGEFLKTTKVFIMTSIVNGLVVAAVQGWRDDDDEEYWKKYLKHLLPYDSFMAIKDVIEKEDLSANDIFNLKLLRAVYGGRGTIGDNLDLFASIPFIAEADSWLQGYSPSRLDYTSILTQAGSVVSTFNSQSATKYKITYGIATLTDYVTGFGISNAMRDIKGLYNQFAAPYTGVRIETTKKAAEKNAKEQDKQAFTKAYESNDLSTAKSAMQDIYDKSIAAGNDESEAWGAVRDTLKEEYLSQIDKHPEDVATINNRFAQLVSYTKHKVSGNYKNYTVDQAKKNYIDKWYASIE